MLKAWEGLGYYRRARQLQAAARQVVREHGGTIPDDPAAVRALPGVGPYIAGAVLSFAFDRPEPIVEANSQRVLARLVALREDVKSTAARRRDLAGRRAAGPAPGCRRLQPGADGPGGPGLHPATAELPVLPRGGALPGPSAGPPGRHPPDDPEAAADRGLRGLCRGPPPRADPDRPARTRGGSGSSSGSSRRSTSRAPIPRADRSAARSSWPRASAASRGSPPRSARRRPRSGTASPTIGSRWRSAGARPGRARAGPGPGLIDARWVEPERLGDFTFSSAGRRLIARIQREPGHGCRPGDRAR